MDLDGNTLDLDDFGFDDDLALWVSRNGEEATNTTRRGQRQAGCDW